MPSTEEKRNKEPRRPGPPGMGRVAEKPKNFKLAIKRLLKGLENFKVLIIISLFLAATGSIIAIFTPNILSDLTDEISKVLIVNSKN